MEVVVGGGVTSLHMLEGDSADNQKTCISTRDSRVDHPPTCTPTHFIGGRHRELVYGCFLFLAKQPTRRPRTCGLDTVLTANDQRTDEAAGMRGRPVAKTRKGTTARTTRKPTYPLRIRATSLHMLEGDSADDQKTYMSTRDSRANVRGRLGGGSDKMNLC